MKNKGLWLLLGFLLLLFGLTAAALQVVGAQWVFLAFLELPGHLFAFVVKILMAMAGVYLIVIANTDWDRERKESQPE